MSKLSKSGCARRMALGVAGTTSWIALSTALVLAAPLAAASATPAAAQETRMHFAIPSGNLADALKAFADKSGVQLVYTSDIVQGATSPGVTGDYTTREALVRLLAGTKLVYRFTSTNTVSIESAPNTRGAKLLGPVEVEGVQTAGANGSTDPTATEGTGSYTSGALTVGSKAPISIKETPQSVSVITHQRIEEQNLTTLTDALNQATGVTLVQSSPIQMNFFSRGFAINNFQIDGGAPLELAGSSYYRTTPDLAEYDHVEILRGSDALFGGAGQPGGIVSLERKRPLDHEQFTVQGQAGSWSNYRTELDATGPIGFDGKLRGRVVVVYQDRDFFYNVAHQSKTLLYGVVEADLPWDTLLRVGGSYERQDNSPFFSNGLPRYSSGADLHLPRSTFLNADWSRWNFETPELFAELEHKLGDDWAFKTSATRLAQTSEEKYGYVLGPVNPVTLAGATFNGYDLHYDTTQYAVDANLSGSFELLGHKHDVTVGADYSNVTTGVTQGLVFTSSPVNIFTFSPAAFDPEPATPPTTSALQPNVTQYGLYSDLRLRILDPLSLIGGFRLSGYHLKQTSSRFSATTGQQTSISITKLNDPSVLTPYGGVVYDLTKTYALYASYADIYQSQANDQSASGQPLPPVTGVTYEIGAKAAWFDGALNGSVAAYHTEESNLAESDPSAPFSSGANGSSCCYLTTGKEVSQGIDLEIAGRLSSGWQISAGYTYNYNSLASGFGSFDGTVLQSQTPKHLLKLWTSYQLPGRFDQWTVGGGIIAQTSNYVSGIVCPSFAPNGKCATSRVPFNFTVGDYAIFNLMARYELNEHWSAALNLNNIFDRTYYQTVGSSVAGNFYGDPRNFMFTLHYSP